MSINSCLNNYYGKSFSKKKMIAIIGHRMDDGMVNPLFNIHQFSGLPPKWIWTNPNQTPEVQTNESQQAMNDG